MTDGSSMEPRQSPLLSTMFFSFNSGRTRTRSPCRRALAITVPMVAGLGVRPRTP